MEPSGDGFVEPMRRMPFCRRLMAANQLVDVQRDCRPHDAVLEVRHRNPRVAAGTTTWLQAPRQQRSDRMSGGRYRHNLHYRK